MKELIKKIESIGFTNYEAKVFLTLYKGYRMSASEIAKEAKIPRTSVYDIVKIFSNKGICNEISTPKKLLYEMIDTNVIQDKIERDIRYTYEKRLSNLQSCFKEIKPLFKTNRPPEYKVDVELIKGFNRQREQKFMQLVRNSKKAVLLMNRLTGNISLELDKEGQKFYKRGGVFKSIYESKGDFRIKINNKWQNVTRDGLIKICEAFSKQGEQVRFLSEVPQLMAVFDEQIVYFSLFDESVPISESSDLIIKNKRFATFITNLFNLYWNKADSIELLKKQIFKKRK